MTRFIKDKYLRKIKLKRYNKYFYLGMVCLFCLIIGLYFAYSKFSVSKDTEVVKTTVGDFIYGDIVVGAYINGEYSSTFPKKDDGYKVEKIICNNNSNATWDNDSWGIVVSNLTKRTKCNVYFISDIKVDFDYTGGEQTFTAPVSGTYKLETWGAQGGNNSYSLDDGYGKGGYSVGYIKIEKSDILYIFVGGAGQSTSDSSGGIGGYNGGGTGGIGANRSYLGGGGGGDATHISLVNELLSSLETSIESILIVSGGGGGTTGGNQDYDKYTAGSGGGFSGAESKKSSNRGSISNASYQNKGFSFGIGQNGVSSIEGNCGAEGNGGGGGGFYGGFSNQSTGGESNSAGAGGSGYIGNSLLKEKTMYCYSCEESSEENTKTISTTCASETPTENCAKKGNGYARITLMSVS